MHEGGGLTFGVSLNVFSSFRLQRVQPDYRIGAKMAGFDDAKHMTRVQPDYRIGARMALR